MLVRHSAKQHPEFDLAEARRIFSSSGHDKDIDGELITSPYDLFCVETLRDRLDLRVGRAHGGVPHLIQSEMETTGQFLCQLGSIQAAPSVLYPWVNHPEPLDLKRIYADENSILFGDMGSIYIFRNADGSLRCQSECY